MDEDELDLSNLDEEVEVIYSDEEDEGEYTTNEPFEFDEEDEVVEAEIVDVSKLTFTKHGTSVFCGALNKEGTLAITGGQDDMAYVWNTENGETVMECTGHKDSITEVAFSFDDQFVVTGDMGGLIQVWNVKERKLEWCYEGSDMEWLSWHHISNVLFAGSNTGDVYIWKIPEGNCKVIASIGASCTCGKVLPDGAKLLSGYANGQIRLWDIKTKSALWSIVKDAPTSITSIDICPDGNLFMVAPSAQLFKLNDGRCVTTLRTDSDIETVGFNSEMKLVATGSLSGTFCVWDYEKNALRHEAKLDAGITTIKWGSKGKLIAGLTDGSIYVCDGLAGDLIEVLTGHSGDILSVTLSENGDCILSTSDDGTAKMFMLKA